MNDDQSAKIPIYVSFLTFTNMLDWLHEMGTVPSKFDRSLWGKKFGGSTGGQLVSGMKFLSLLDGENTTPELDRLAMAERGERKALLADLLRASYGEAMVDGLPKMTVRMLNDGFEALGSTDATRRKAVSFFINAAKAADLPIHSLLAKQARNRPATTRKAGNATSKPKPKGDESKPLTPEVKTSLDLPTGLHEALVPLLKDLARDGANWTSRAKARWKATWDANLDYAYPVEDEPEQGQRG
jgi:hypothetical protein